MLRSKWCLVLGILAVGTFAMARDVELNNVSAVDEGAVMGGTLMEGTGALATDGDIVYQSANISGYYFRPYPGYRDYDDIHLEDHGKYDNGNLVAYSMSVFGSTTTGADAGSPFDVTTCLYEDQLGDPSIGIPAGAPIPGTCCTFPQVPTGMWTLTCEVPAGIAIPQGLWLSFETTTDNSGWLIADFNDCPTTGPIGYSEDFWAEEDLIYGGFSFFWFGGCPANPQSSFGAADIVAEGQPWACCDYTTFGCVNILETECAGIGMFTEDTLCNDLPGACSEAGACCDTASGACEDTFEFHCDGALQVFTPAELCANVVCDVPPNVPTLTQWGMIALTVLMLAGLTIKFGRRRTVTA